MGFQICALPISYHGQNAGGLPHLTELTTPPRKAQRFRQHRFAEIRRGCLGEKLGQQAFLVRAVFYFSVRPERRLSACGGRGTTLIPRPFPSSAVRPQSRGRTGAKYISVRPVAARHPAAQSIFLPATRATVHPPRRCPSRTARFPAAA